ncbi:MAG: hypothetical protein ABI045_00695 [Flavobacteriales bacterium]
MEKVTFDAVVFIAYGLFWLISVSTWLTALKYRKLKAIGLVLGSYLFF